jgi:pimeloyl-ACP methyl ester carboxylesterase
MRPSRCLGTLVGLAIVIGACRPSAVTAPLGASQPTATPETTGTLAPTLPASPETMSAILERLGGTPCPDSDFTCLTLTVPLDHFNPDGGATIDVVFAVLPATGERKGMFVTVTGGPGSSGLSAADDYTSAFDPSLPEHFDIVFFDQRGVGTSGGLQCVEAAATFYRTEMDTTTPEGEAALAAAAQAFALDCVQETGRADLLPYLGTRQAVEDLEDFRQAMGDERLWLYGESYGTQYAQTYAAAHPEHLAALILDGTVDLTLSGPEFYRQQAQAFSDVLTATLEACNADPGCAVQFGGDALAFYDRLADRLARSPAAFSFPLPSGGISQRSFTLSDLEAATAGELYTENSRGMLLRALAGAARDDLVPLARLVYQDLGLDPETQEPILDPTYSDATYYAVECADYDYFSGTPAERAQAYLRAGDAVDQAVPRLSSIFYGDLPCVFWPVLPDPRPAPLTAEGIPTFVLGATSDPATPVSNGIAVYHRLVDGYLVTTQGGPHIIFGRGDACPDNLVTAFLVKDLRPAQRESTCPGEVVTAYVPLAPVEASAFADPLEALVSADTELYYLPEYYYWDLESPTTVGCPYGGTFAFEAVDVGEQFTLSGCAFSAGFVMSGTGSYNYDEDRFELDVAVTGPGTGNLVYVRQGDTAGVTGEYDGQPVDLSR